MVPAEKRTALKKETSELSDVNKSKCIHNLPRTEHYQPPKKREKKTKKKKNCHPCPKTTGLMSSNPATTTCWNWLVPVGGCEFNRV